MIAVSLVSHGHGAMVANLVEQVLAYPEVGQVFVTYNLPEASVPFPDGRVEVILNSSPYGFGENHNRAFCRSREPYWCVLNPDIGLYGNPFPILIEALKMDAAGLVAPLVISPSGIAEDSIRRFPSLSSLALKLFGWDRSRYEVLAERACFHPEWVAGMFQLFRADAYAAVNGFDERYFLYYEDVDICARLWKAGIKVLACPLVSVVHDARRDSHRSLKYFRFHLVSMARFFCRHWARLPKVDSTICHLDLRLRNKTKQGD